MPDQTILVIDHNGALLTLARERFPDITVVPNRRDRGLSGARNTGVELCRGEIVAFLDDDAVARPTWLGELVGGYVDKNVMGTGGVVQPRWISGKRPSWLPEEFYWTVGCSYRGLPTLNVPIRNPIGANMSFRRDAIVLAGGFRDGIGRTDIKALGCEETELAIRVINVGSNGRILHIPTALVDHRVDVDRVNWRYFRARCWAEGLSKATVTTHVGRAAGLASERTYALRTLPSGVVRGVCDALRFDRMGLVRAVVIPLGLTITAAGYVRGRIAQACAASVEDRAT